MISTDVFVGRRYELEILDRKMDAAFDGSGSLVVLAGEAGVGKTRIAAEFSRRARLRDASVLRGACFETEWQRPYSIWVAALGDYGAERGDGQSRADAGASAGLVQVLREIGVALPELGAAGVLSVEEERLRLYDAVVRFLLAIDRPAVLFLDDLQWADPDSIRLLRHVSRFLPRSRVLLVGSYRYPDVGMDPYHPLRDVLAMLQLETDFELITVRGLSDLEVAEYLKLTLNQPAPTEFARRLAEETGGNPFYLRELLRHMSEENKLRGGDERWTDEIDFRGLGIPEGVRQVVDRRVSRLSDDTRSMITLASGFADQFQFPVLQELTGLPDEALLNCLDEALQAGFLLPARDALPAYEFAHAIVREGVYCRLNPDRRVRLHRRIADSLERVYAGRESEHASELASQYHASAALPGSSKGVAYALEAAAQSRSQRAYEQSAHFLHMARELSAESPPSERSDVLCRLTLAQAEAFLLDDSRNTVEEALGAMELSGAEPEALARFLSQAARSLKEAGANPSYWEPLVERGLALVAERRDLLWARLTLLKEQFEPISSGAISIGRWLGHDPEAVAIARQLGDEDDFARTLDSPDPPTRQETDSIFEMVLRWKRPSAIMAAMATGARDLFYRHGAFVEAADRYQELLAVAERHGAIPEQAEALAQLSVARAILGDLPEARSSSARADAIIERLGTSHGLRFMELAVDVMLAYYLGGDWLSLEAKAERLLSRQAVGRPRYPLARIGLAAAAMAAYVHCRAGNRAEALRHLAGLTPIAGRMDPSSFAQNSVITIGAGTVWELGVAEYAGAYREAALRLIETGVGSGPVGPHQLAVARMAVLQGDASAAEQYFDDARRCADREGLRPSRAVADFDEALGLLRLAPGGRQRIVALLDAASNAFRLLGMEEWERRAIDLRERVMAGRSADSSGVISSTGTSSIDRSELAREMSPLSEREREVVGLLAAGLSNAEIAARLVISIRTAEAHVASILGKLGLSSRTQVVVWAMQRGMESHADR